MNYEQYVGGETTQYEAFSQTVASIIRAAISNCSEKIRLQQITARAKSVTSLQRKLTERDLLRSEKIEAELKDLAGCRLIFYTNSDVDRFLQSRMIFDNFVIDFDGSNIHHAVGTDRSADDLYFAIHYLVSLKPDRLGLPEFSKFRGMRCEVQIQTILNHAWAETTHDILYHRPVMKGFGTRQFQEIEKRLANLMNKYLLPAGYEFQKVQHDFDRLMEGKEVFERGEIEQLEHSKNNNERYDSLQRIQKMLPYYDDVAAIAPELLRACIDAIKKARSVDLQAIETPFGSFEGHSLEYVVRIALEIIETIRYVDIEATFRAYCGLYLTASNRTEGDKITQAVERLADNDFRVWRQVGFGVQNVLQSAVSALSVEDRQRLKPIVLTVCRQCLDPEISGTTWHANSVSLHRGAVQASEEYGTFRGRTLDLLFEMYQEPQSEEEKRAIIGVLKEATIFPGDGGGDALIELILADTQRIAEFFTNRVANEPLEIRSTLERHLLFVYRRCKGFVAVLLNPAIQERARMLAVAILICRDRLGEDPQYVMFKTLVGYDSVFPPDWESDGMDIAGEEAYRVARVSEYVDSVTDANADEWYNNIVLCASVVSNDGATFLSFIEFLKQVSRRHSTIVLSFLKRDDEKLRGFLPPILEGLAASEQKPAVMLLVNSWADQGRYLREIALFCRFVSEPDIDLVRKVSRKAIETQDLIAAIESIATVIGTATINLADEVFIPSVRFLSTAKDARWINAVWFLPKLKEFLLALSEPDAGEVLSNMLYRSRIGHHDERVLMRIATTYPQLVWRFFKLRLDQKSAEGLGSDYEAIPFELHDLVKSLSANATLAVAIVRSWYSAADTLFSYEGGRLLRSTFPSFGEEFEGELVKLVQNGVDEDVDFVFQILRAYRGEVFLHPVCKEIVNCLEDNDPRIEIVQVILDSTGVVSGQFGFVGAYQAKQAELKSWLGDERPKVREFAEKHLRSLGRHIASEQRRSEASFELRRRDWPDEPESGGDEKK
jgi:ppGpp synthetase/RelA/SpoT-type nucleotidyltranferase